MMLGWKAWHGSVASNRTLERKFELVSTSGQAAWDNTFETILLSVHGMESGATGLDPDLDLVTWGLSSISVISLITKFESAYDIEIPFDEHTFGKFSTPLSIWEMVQETRMGRKASGE